jgi:hypothetical protein
MRWDRPILPLLIGLLQLILLSVDAGTSVSARSQTETSTFFDGSGDDPN